MIKAYKSTFWCKQNNKNKNKNYEMRVRVSRNKEGQQGEAKQC
jgi:hypothetical protein